MKMLKTSSMLIIVVLTAMIVSVSSCTKEDDPEPVLGNFTIDGRVNVLYDGAIFPDEEGELKDDESIIYQHDIILSGEANHGIYFSLINATTALESGTYTFVDYDYLNQYNPRDVYRMSVTENSSYQDISAGTVEVTKVDKKYTFEITATVNGFPVSASYEGELQVVN